MYIVFQRNALCFEIFASSDFIVGYWSLEACGSISINLKTWKMPVVSIEIKHAKFLLSFWDNGHLQELSIDDDVARQQHYSSCDSELNENDPGNDSNESALLV